MADVDTKKNDGAQLASELRVTVCDTRCSSELVGIMIRNRWLEIESALRSAHEATAVANKPLSDVLTSRWDNSRSFAKDGRKITVSSLELAHIVLALTNGERRNG